MAVWISIYLAIGVVNGVMTWRGVDRILRGEEGAGEFFVTNADGEDITPQDNPTLYTGILFTMVIAAVLLWPLGFVIQYALNKKKGD